VKNISIVALSLVMSSMVSSAAYAVSDVCCGDPLTCFCFKDGNGDWKKGGWAKPPPNAQTKGLQFKEAAQLSADKTEQPQGNESVKTKIFDRWGNLKTKKDCGTGGGVWAGEDGKGECTGPRK
jgi:hypothetical protein